jgi:hypothetical protein
MALDTANKRLAVIGWGFGSLPLPDGALDAGDREQLLGMPRFSDGAATPADGEPLVVTATHVTFARTVLTRALVGERVS